MNFKRILTMSLVGATAGMIAFSAFAPKSTQAISQTQVTAQPSLIPAVQMNNVAAPQVVQPDVSPTTQVVQNAKPVTQDNVARTEQVDQGDDNAL